MPDIFTLKLNAIYRPTATGTIDFTTDDWPTVTLVTPTKYEKRQMSAAAAGTGIFFNGFPGSVLCVMIQNTDPLLPMDFAYQDGFAHTITQRIPPLMPFIAPAVLNSAGALATGIGGAASFVMAVVGT